jgi:transposase
VLGTRAQALVGGTRDRSRTRAGRYRVHRLALRGARSCDGGDHRHTDTHKRRLAAEPILKRLYQWVEQERPRLVDESPIAKAMNYLVNQREPLGRFLDDGQLWLDNNLSEVELRRQVVGRANWTLCGSDDGAEWNAIATSLIASFTHSMTLSMGVPARRLDAAACVAEP